MTCCLLAGALFQGIFKKSAEELAAFAAGELPERKASKFRLFRRS